MIDPIVRRLELHLRYRDGIIIRLQPISPGLRDLSATRIGGHGSAVPGDFLERVRYYYKGSNWVSCGSFASFRNAPDAERNEGVSNAVSPAGRVQSVRWEETC